MTWSLTPWNNSFSCLRHFPQTSRRTIHFPLIRAVQAAEPDKQNAAQKSDESANAQSSSTAPRPPKKPVYSMKKGQIVRVNKDKYLNSINMTSMVNTDMSNSNVSISFCWAPTLYKGLDYIYEDRGEVLDMRIFETGEHALIAWAGIPTAPAWLPTYMLIKSEKLNYERL